MAAAAFCAQDPRLKTSMAAANAAPCTRTDQKMMVMDHFEAPHENQELLAQ